jgi:L-threonylcarbamoyladenylate synthase
MARAAEILRGGGLVAFPTETVYGLGARADAREAVLGIFRAKGRPQENPLIVHVADRAQAAALAGGWSDEAEQLARAFWPGPLTLVAPFAAGSVAAEVVAGGDTVALRVPSHPVARRLLLACGLPLAAPSANTSTSLSPTTADHVCKSLGGRIDAVIDGGACDRGIESTIVDVSARPPRLLRYGAVALTDIERALGSVGAVVDLADRSHRPGERLAAPGGYERHYAPRARVVLVEAGAVADEVRARRTRGEVAGALERAPGSAIDPPSAVLPGDVEGYAAALYAALHRLDDAGCDVIVVSLPPGVAAWAAVQDRLRRASC